MSLIKVQGNASGTGILTIAAPNTNTDRTLTLPDNTGTIATAESTLSQFNASGSAPVYACRAWVNFNGTGTVEIRASGNVSSITDNGSGNYTINFTTTLTDTNYGVSSFVRKDNASTDAAICAAALSTSTKTTSALQIICLFRNPTSQGTFDSPEVGVSVFR